MRVVLLTVSTVAGAGVAVAALTQVFRHEVKRSGQEQRAVVNLSAPFGSIIVGSTTAPNTLALIETQSEEDNAPNLQVSYVTRQSTGVLKITVGEDEGQNMDPQLASVYRAQGGWNAVNYRQTDDGRVLNMHDVRSYAPVRTSPDFDAKVFLTREIPLALGVKLGFGESLVDLTGLTLNALNIDAEASQSHVIMRSPNAGRIEVATVSAGVGEFEMDGIANLNANRFVFSGGIGMYELTFSGKLAKNMDADVTVGLGRVSIRIPPEAARVQVFYDDGLFCSFNFAGLSRRRDGYATSAGFEHSKAPILTLRLSSGMGRMDVRYR